MAIKLLVFPHSHYCEKARWALDFKGIDYHAQAIMPGFHIRTLKKYAPNSTVPILLHDDDAVQGSSAIINFLDERYASKRLSPVAENDLEDCLQLEQKMDLDLGVNLRQILYARLLDYPDFIRHCFVHPMPRYKQGIFSFMYPVLSSKIYQNYVISEEKVAQAKIHFDLALELLKQRLQHRDYLIGNEFCRADLSIASMLSLLVMPEEHPFPWPEIPDKELGEFILGYNEHPVSEWVRGIYRQHRPSNL